MTSYTKHTWVAGELATAAYLNNMETGIYNNNTDIQNLIQPIVIDPNWELGSISTTSGADSTANANKRLRTPDFHYSHTGATYYMPSGIRGCTYTYTTASTSTFIEASGWVTGTVSIPAGVYFRLVAAFADDSDIVVADAANVVVTINTAKGGIIDVQSNGTSVLNNGIANIPAADSNTFGVIRPNANSFDFYNGGMIIRDASETEVKAGNNSTKALSSRRIHNIAFYGLTKAAGVDMSSSSNAIGTYTTEAKAAIKAMIGVTVDDVQINSTSIVNNGVANIPVASGNNLGVVTFGTGANTGIRIENNIVKTDYAGSSLIKAGANGYCPIVPMKQHEAVFYGLAKAAGVDEKDSENSVGTYTTSAKTAIKTMLGVAVDDVQIDSTSIISNNIATIPAAAIGTYGVVKLAQYHGLQISDGSLVTEPATNSQIKAPTTGDASTYRPITPRMQDQSVFYGLAKAAGDTTQSSSDNAVGTYTDTAKTKIKEMLGVETATTLTGATQTITAAQNTTYICGELSSLSFTPCATGLCEVIFESGTTATTLTVPNTVVFPEWFNPSALLPNSIYEISIRNGTLGVVGIWDN